MAKKQVSGIVAEIKKLVESNEVVFGAEKSLKLLRQGKLKKLYLSSNCSDEVREDAQRYCEISGTECVPLTQTNDEIGVMCRKPFSISVVGVKA